MLTCFSARNRPSPLLHCAAVHDHSCSPCRREQLHDAVHVDFLLILAQPDLMLEAGHTSLSEVRGAKHVQSNYQTK